jgi:hypothetical protein
MYATHFEDGREITPYLASAYAEGFCEGENASDKDCQKAWSYLCGTKLGYSLQGFYGRTIQILIDGEFMAEDGTILKEVQ